MAAGCTAYLTKPIKQEVLLQAIKEHSDGRASVIESGEQPKDPIVVRANPEFTDLIPAFLQNRRQDVIAMLDALDRGDFETVASLGHGMKGAGGSCGFQAITDIGAALEQAAESADNDASRKWVGELSRYLDRVEVVPQTSPGKSSLTPRFTTSGEAGAHACGELRNRKRLGHIVRHPCFKAGARAGLIGHGGEHQHGQGSVAGLARSAFMTAKPSMPVIL